MKKIVLLLSAIASILLLTACDSSSELDNAAIHQKNIADGFTHYRLSNPPGKEYNLIMLVMVDDSGNIRIGAAGHAKEARDSGDFDVYIKVIPNGFSFHYVANGEYVKWGGGNLAGITAYAAAPESIKPGDFLVKTSSREDKAITPDWSKPAAGETAITIVTLLWNKNLSLEDPALIDAVRKELKKR